MVEGSIVVKFRLLRISLIALLGTLFATPSLTAQEASKHSDLQHCSKSLLATRDEMVPPYLAVTISADDRVVIGATRSSNESYVVDVTEVETTDSLDVAAAITLALNGETRRIFVYADSNSRSASLISVLAALQQTGNCDWSVVTNFAGN
jgi:biopolymer transport protein ExbD